MSSCMSASTWFVVVVDNATAVGADDGLDDKLIAPTEAVPLTSEDPSIQSMLESS